MKRKISLRLLPLLALILAGATVAALAAGAGSESDPLVTRSYLEGPYRESILEEADQLLAERNRELERALEEQVQGETGNASSGAANAAAAFQEVTLEAGQTLTGGVGTEVLLRQGAALCSAPGDPGLVDTTDGSTLSSGGALAANHLYLMTAAGRGVAAQERTVLLVRGSYTTA